MDKNIYPQIAQMDADGFVDGTEPRMARMDTNFSVVVGGIKYEKMVE